MLRVSSRIYLAFAMSTVGTRHSAHSLIRKNLYAEEWGTNEAEKAGMKKKTTWIFNIEFIDNQQFFFRAFRMSLKIKIPYEKKKNLFDLTVYRKFEKKNELFLELSNVTNRSKLLSTKDANYARVQMKNRITLSVCVCVCEEDTKRRNDW